MRYVALLTLFLSCLVLGCGGPAKKVTKKKVPTTVAKAPAKKTKTQSKQPAAGTVANNQEGTPFLRPDQLQPGTTIDPTATPRGTPATPSNPASPTTAVQADGDVDPLALIGKKDAVVVRIDARLFTNPLFRAIAHNDAPFFFLIPPDVKFSSAWLFISPTDEPPLDFATYLVFESADERNKTLMAGLKGQVKTVEFEGKKYQIHEGEKSLAFCSIGERGIFSSDEERVREVLAHGPATSKLAGLMKPVQGKGQVTAAIDLARARAMSEGMLKELDLPPQLGEFLKGVDSGALAFDLNGKQLLDLHLRGANPTQGEELEKNAQALLNVAGTLVGNMKVEFGNEPSAVSQRAMLGLVEKLLAAVRVERQGETVHLSVARPAELERLPEMLASGKKESEDASKAKYPTYIAQAIQRGFVFPIADFLGAERKAKQPLLSWRVMLLSPLEQSPLLDLINLEEPWDSERNKKVLDKMPVYFETSYAPEKGTTTWKLLPDRNGGVILVEGGPGSAVPWTKPDQVKFDPEKPLAQFGEEPPGGYRVILTGSWDPVRLSAAELKAKLKAVMKHENAVSALAIDTEGKLLVSAGLENKVILWDLAIGKELAIWEGHTESIHSVAISKDGKFAASGSGDRTIRIWDVAARKLKHTLKGHESWGVDCVAFFPDSKRLASAGHDDTVRIWEIESGNNTVTLKCPRGMTGVAVSPDGKRLAGSGLDGTLILWNLEKGNTEMRLSGFKENVYCVAFSPDSKTLAAGGGDEIIKLWNATDGKEKGSLPQLKDDIKFLMFDKTGAQLLCADRSSSGITLWDLSASTLIARFKYGSDQAVIHPDGKTVYTMVHSIIQPYKLEERVTDDEK